MARPLTLVDTTVLIDLLRGSPAALAYLQRLERRLIASEVTRIEIIRGLRPAERPAAEAMFRAIGWVAVDENIARRAGQLGRHWARSHGAIGLADLIIAATAEEYGAELATSNIKHFPMFAGLLPPYAAE
jgi:predicted nucleic acid-binding protein